jgi:hypothetical protein
MKFLHDAIEYPIETKHPNVQRMFVLGCELVYSSTFVYFSPAEGIMGKMLTRPLISSPTETRQTARC